MATLPPLSKIHFAILHVGHLRLFRFTNVYRRVSLQRLDHLLRLLDVLLGLHL